MFELKVEVRNIFGTKKIKKARKKGEIPAVLYGKKRETFYLNIALETVTNLLKSG